MSARHKVSAATVAEDFKGKMLSASLLKKYCKLKLENGAKIYIMLYLYLN